VSASCIAIPHKRLPETLLAWGRSSTNLASTYRAVDAQRSMTSRASVGKSAASVKTSKTKKPAPKEAKKAAAKATPKKTPLYAPQARQPIFVNDPSLLREVAPAVAAATTPEQKEALKKSAGVAAAKLIANHQTVGLGTGSTAKYFVDALGARLSDAFSVKKGIPTSTRTADQAAALGISLGDVSKLGKAKSIDIAVDGADQVQLVKDASGRSEAWLIKGGGGAALQEKEVAIRAKRFVVIVDPSKVVEKLGKGFPLPVMVKPANAKSVKAELEGLGAVVTLRPKDKADPASKPFVDDTGNYVLDADFRDGIDKPYALQASLEKMKGVAAHGLFLGMTDDLVVGTGASSTVTRRFDR
jgi:ribose 5-phosphate isomerase A